MASRSASAGSRPPQASNERVDEQDDDEKQKKPYDYHHTSIVHHVSVPTRVVVTHVGELVAFAGPARPQ